MEQRISRAKRTVADVPMDQRTPDEVGAHMQFMEDHAAQLQANGEYIEGQALSPEGTFVRYVGEGRPPVIDVRSRKPRT